MFASVQSALQPAFEAISNMNLGAVELGSCVVGPRHKDRLSFSAGLVLFLIGLPWLTALTLQLLATVKGLSKSLAGAAHATTKFATRNTVRIAFLLYPSTATSVLRTWIYDE